jgi:hypothetical protein
MRTMLVLICLTAGCYSPKINDGDFQCTSLCPAGFQCVAGRCYRQSTVLDLGVGTFAGDGTGGALMLDNSAAGVLSLNADNGEIRFSPSGAASMIMFAAGQSGFRHLTQPSGGPPMGLWNFTTVNIPAGVSVVPAGTGNSLTAIAASTTMLVRASVDWRGFGGSGGAAHMAGGARDSGVRSGGGSGGDDASGSGGGGAGYLNDGATGGGTSPGMPGAHYGDVDLRPVHAGSGGGGGGGLSGAVPGAGGLGGGALILLGHSITIGGTINVSGNPGKSADPSSTATAGGGGGGSAGSILVSADAVTLENGHSLIARGGRHGDGAASGQGGGDGSDGRIAVFGTLTFTGGATSISAAPGATMSSVPLAEFPR